MKAEEVTAILYSPGSGIAPRQAHPAGCGCYLIVAPANLARWPDGRSIKRVRSAPSSNEPGQDRALAAGAQEPHPGGKPFHIRRSRGPDQDLHRDFNLRRRHETSTIPPADIYLGPCPARSNDRLSPRVVCSTSCALPDFINLRSRTLL